MTKLELEEVNKRLEKENEIFRNILYDIKQQMVYADDIYSKGLAEETDFNLGIQHTLEIISEIINSKIKESSYLYCPTFRDIIAERESAPTFTIIEGGLSKKKKNILN